MSIVYDSSEIKYLEQFINGKLCDQLMATTDHVGKRIRQRRMEKGFNLRQLAEKTGVSASFLSQVEHGKVNVSLGSLQNISEALDVPLLYFVKEKTSDEEVLSNHDCRIF